jgi:hypothetical protein
MFIYDRPVSEPCFGNFSIKKSNNVWTFKPIFHERKQIPADHFLMTFVRKFEAYLQKFNKTDKFDNTFAVSLDPNGRVTVDVKAEDDILPEWRSFQAVIENDEWVLYLANGARVRLLKGQFVYKQLHKLKRKISEIKVNHDV